MILQAKPRFPALEFPPPPVAARPGRSVRAPGPGAHHAVVQQPQDTAKPRALVIASKTSKAVTSTTSFRSDQKFQLGRPDTVIFSVRILGHVIISTDSAPRARRHRGGMGPYVSPRAAALNGVWHHTRGSTVHDIMTSDRT